jgi:abequosyltransferase
MKNNIILSICIPTFNRAEYLEDTLQSIVSQKKFIETDEVEIVISDNCSEDNTKDVCLKYIEIYGNKIRYFRNTENIKDANFERVLSYGNGVYLKLNNDTLMHRSNTLDKIIDVVNYNKDNKDILFFSNNELNNKSITSHHSTNLDDFVRTVSFLSTWIGGFGIWKSDFNSINNFGRHSQLQLVQTDVLLRIAGSNRSAFVDNSKIFDSITPSKKGGYNIYKVFVTNYLDILNEYRAQNKISWTTLFNEKSKLMRYFIIPWTLNIWRDNTRYIFDRKGALRIVFKKYCFHPIFYVGLFYVAIKILITPIKSC